jgi:hypothetical protein
MNCNEFLNNPSIHPLTKSPLSKEQLIEFRKSCGFNKDIYIEPNDITYTMTNNIFEEYLNKAVSPTIQPKESIDNIKWWVNSQKKYLDSLTTQDLTIIKFYETIDMFEWNKVMRGQLSPCDTKKSPNEYINEFLWFYELITKAPRTPRMFLFRGENNDTFDTYNLPYLKDGNIIKEGFISMSLSSYLAYMYSSTKWINGKPNIVGDEKNRLLYIVEIPAGTPALFISAKNYPNFDERFEVVLPPCIWRNVGNKTINIGKYVINAKMVILESILPLNKSIKDFSSPSIDNIITEFVTRLISIKNENYTWVIEGNYGLTTMLYYRYKVQNLKNVSSINLTCYYKNGLKSLTSNKIYENISAEIIKKYELSEDRITYSLFSEDDSSHVYIIRYSLCPNRKTDIINLKYINRDFDKTLIDYELYKKIGIPIKTKEGYIKEINSLINESLIENNSDLLYKPTIELKKLLSFLQSLN